MQLGKCFLQPSGDFHAVGRILESVTRQSNPAFASVEINKLKQQGWEKPFRHAVGARGGEIGAHTTGSSAAASASNL